MTVIADRYELGALLGTGSSAVVHRAWDRERGTAVAVKLTVDVGVHDPRRHRREMDALTRVRHPGLVALHGGGIDDGVPYLVLDLVDGPTLAERILLGGPLTADSTRRLGARVAAALAAVHAAGIVHRDVKPANVLLEPDGTPRLTDFGIARALDTTSLTRTGTVLGTAAFLAPEQVRGHDVTGAADVYALGLVLLEAVTGRREYPGSAVESATARLHRPPVVPRELPASLARALRAMTAAEPARRPTATAVAAALAVEPGTSAIPAWRRAAGAHRPQLVAAAALVVVTAALGSVLVGGSPVAVPDAVPAAPAAVDPASTAPQPPPATLPVTAAPAPAPPATDGAAAPGEPDPAGDARSERREKPGKVKPGRSGGEGGPDGSGRGRN